MHNRNSESQWFNVDIFIGLQKLLSTFTKHHRVDSTAVFILFFFTYLPENQSEVRVTRSCKFATVMVFIATFHNIRESSSNVSHTYYIMTNIRWCLIMWYDSGAGTAYPSRAPEFTPVFSGVRVNTQSLDLYAHFCMFCRSLFVLLYFFFWPLCCLFFFDIQILITPLVSSNSS
jgi:hypothetical protein